MYALGIDLTEDEFIEKIDPAQTGSYALPENQDVSSALLEETAPYVEYVVYYQIA